MFFLTPLLQSGKPFSAAWASSPTHNSMAFSPQAADLESVQRLALELVNRDRAEAGLSAMGMDSVLSRAAQSHAEDMLRRNYFSHYSPEGQAPSDRLTAAGGQGYPAENIVMTQNPRIRRISIQILEQFEQQWMESAGHRRNLMNPNYTRFGYGFAIDPNSGRIFAVQMFRRP